MITHPHATPTLDAALSRSEVGALLVVGLTVFAVIAVASCVLPVLAAIVRRIG